MDYEFSSKEELFTRVGPALRAKLSDMQRLGYSYIKEIDIWNYLIVTKWSKSVNLMLSDVVHDILNVDDEEIDNFLKDKLKNANRTLYFDGIEML